MEAKDAFELNRAMWNARVPLHLTSRMYDLESFVAGRNSLTAIELELLGDVAGKCILHLQCHFGQDTLSLARMGAAVTGLDISDTAIAEAQRLTERCGLKASWVLSNVIDPVPELDGRFDIVYTSFGTIGWLPDLRPWAANIKRYLKPGGRLVFVEFHPVMWMFDNDFTGIAYSYFNRQTIVEEEQGTYADREANIKLESHSWNHSLGDVITAVLNVGLRIERFTELDGSPHDCFRNAAEGEDGMYRIKGMEGKLPMVYGLRAQRAS
jgi:SAM-dependent methyltransferase